MSSFRLQLTTPPLYAHCLILSSGGLTPQPGIRHFGFVPLNSTMLLPSASGGILRPAFCLSKSLLISALQNSVSQIYLEDSKGSIQGDLEDAIQHQCIFTDIRNTEFRS
ncbi:hypothetical protein HOY80DRAFT_1051664 [Tuber brumale]|nr:hypothetical protein HOY80DRAFT_1051664 [Tuber brumale]